MRAFVGASGNRSNSSENFTEGAKAWADSSAVCGEAEALQKDARLTLCRHV